MRFSFLDEFGAFEISSEADDVERKVIGISHLGFRFSDV
jgi:hypothetical protein